MRFKGKAHEQFVLEYRLFVRHEQTQNPSNYCSMTRRTLASKGCFAIPS